jgi:hypothetical protein
MVLFAVVGFMAILFHAVQSKKHVPIDYGRTVMQIFDDRAVVQEYLRLESIMWVLSSSLHVGCHHTVLRPPNSRSGLFSLYLCLEQPTPSLFRSATWSTTLGS